VRKRTSVPYVAHLLAVAATVLEYGGDEDMAIGALLHDAAEDQGGSARLQDIRNRFGDRVANFVGACSDSLANTAAGEKKAGWHERKEKYLAHLLEMDTDTLLISLADKVHNARSILRDLRKADVGAAVWSRFSASREDTLWYYDELAKVFQRVLPGQLSDELADIARALRV
jgi:(p)ppGpp synthase/HD superfamily hydrolase